MIVLARVPLRVWLGGVIGFLIHAVLVSGTFLRMAINPSVAERATSEATTAMLRFSIFFIAAGAGSGWLSMIRSPLARYSLIGGLNGALIWSYFAATWPLTTRGLGAAPAYDSVPEAMGIGSVLGVMGGSLLGAITWLRSLPRARR